VTTPSHDLSWRLVVDEEPRSGAANMALDHALAEVLPPNEGVLRFYRWSAPTISFGRNEPARGRYDRTVAEEEGLGVVRRPTGGRAVLHAQEVTYCAVLPLRALGGLRSTYLQVNRGLVEGLRGLGARAEIARERAALRPDRGPCFQSPSAGEVTLGGRKLVGSAQARLGANILQHGSVILRGDQSALVRVAGGVEDPHPPATLEEAAGEIVWADVARELAEGMRVALGGCWKQGGYESRELCAARRLEVDRYATESWTWRR
jgi:lipoate-protein ligase A